MLAFLFAAPVLLVPNVIQRVGDYLVPGVTAADLLVVLRSIALLVTGYALPLAFLFGLMLALGRLAGDGELAAMRACGIRTRALLLPAAGLGALFTAAALVLSLGVEHHAWRALESTKLRLASYGSVIETGRFQRFGERMILVRERDGNRLGGVAITDWSEGDGPMLIFAEEAQLAFDPERGRLRFALEHGDMRMEPGPSDAWEEYRISFSHVDYSFPAPSLRGDRWRMRPSHLTPAENAAASARAAAGERLPGMKYQHARFYDAQVHRLVTVPLAPLLFAFLAVPLGAHGRVRSKARGVLFAVAIFAVYYALFVFGYDSARAGRLPATPALWAPNALLVAASIVLWRSGIPECRPRRER